MLASITLTSVASVAVVRSPTQDAQHVGLIFEIAVASAVADARDAHGGERAEVGGERCDEGGSGGRGEFDGGAARVDGFAFEQRRGGGGGDGEHAVFGVDGAAADVDGRGMDFADVEEVERYAGAYDVGDGIDGSDFVEVDFFDGNAVDAGFGVA